MVGGGGEMLYSLCGTVCMTVLLLMFRGRSMTADVWLRLLIGCSFIDCTCFVCSVSGGGGDRPLLVSKQDDVGLGYVP